MLANWIRMSTTTTGPGPLTVAGVSGYPGVTSQLATGERADYVILDSSNLPIERGVGYWNGSAWVRDVVKATFAGGIYTGAGATAVSLASGDKYLIVSPGAQSVAATRPGIWSSTYRAYGDVGIGATTTTYSLAANRAIAIPAVAAVDSPIDAVMCRVTTAGTAGAQAKGAIFSVGSDGLPGVMLAEGAAVATDSTGVKASTFAAFQPPPVFFVCVLGDTAATLAGYNNGTFLREGMGTDSNLVPCGFVHHNSATGLTFPATWAPVGNFNVARPVLFMRCP